MISLAFNFILAKVRWLSIQAHKKTTAGTSAVDIFCEKICYFRCKFAYVFVVLQVILLNFDKIAFYTLFFCIYIHIIHKVIHRSNPMVAGT